MNILIWAKYLIFKAALFVKQVNGNKVNIIYSRTPFTYIFFKKMYVYMGVRIHMCTIFLKV